MELLNKFTFVDPLSKRVSDKSVYYADRVGKTLSVVRAIAGVSAGTGELLPTESWPSRSREAWRDGRLPALPKGRVGAKDSTGVERGTPALPGGRQGARGWPEAQAMP